MSGEITLQLRRGPDQRAAQSSSTPMYLNSVTRPAERAGTFCSSSLVGTGKIFFLLPLLPRASFPLPLEGRRRMSEGVSVETSELGQEICLERDLIEKLKFCTFYFCSTT